MAQINDSQEQVTINVETLQPVTRTLMTIGALPTSYLISMTYEEQLLWLQNYLIKTVIPAINNNAEATQEVQDIVMALQQYINDYFNNLDVQEEINNKLEQMALDGSLTTLIEDYVNPYIEAQNQEISNFKTQVNQDITDFKSNVNNQIAQQNAQIQAVESGSPLVASSVSGMTDTTKTYVNTTDGNWYYYNGSAWTIGGVYQNSNFGNNDVKFNNLENQIQEFFDFDFVDIKSTLTFESGFYNYSNGNKQENNNVTCTQLSVNPGEIYRISGYGTSNARAYNLINADNTVNSFANNANIDDIIIIPNSVNKLQINIWNTHPNTYIFKSNRLILNDYEMERIEELLKYYSEEHQNVILQHGTPSSHFGEKFSFTWFNYPENFLSINDEIEISFKMGSNNLNAITSILTTIGGGVYEENISNLNYEINQDIKISTSISSIASNNRFYIGVKYGSEDIPDCLTFIYDLKIKNKTKDETINNLYEYINTTNVNASTTFEEYFVYSLYNSKDYIESLNNEFYFNKTNKTIICSGDSLTDYNAHTNSSYVMTLRKNYPNANVLNYGSSGSRTNRLVNNLTNMARDLDTTHYPIRNPDYLNCSAVLICIGTNSETTIGTYENSVPQISNVTDINGNSINYINVNLAITDGFYYNGVLIDTEEKYWDLFANDYYGNLSLCIEYIQYKNPKTQIFLFPPLIAYNKIPTSPTGAYTISERMKELCLIYGINYIDTISGINVNQRNSNLFTYDGTHGTAERDEMLGQYISRQINNKIIFN